MASKHPPSVIGLARILPGDNPVLRRGWVVVGAVAAAAVVVWSIVGLRGSPAQDHPPILVAPLVVPTTTTFSSAPVLASMAPLPSPRTHAVPTVPTAARRSPTPSSRPSPTRAGASVAAAYSVSSNWETGFVAAVHLTNTGSTPQNWTITITHDGAAGVGITDAWNGTLTRQGATNVLTGGPLAPGSSVNVGFEATKKATGPVRPTRCTVNQSACSVS